MGKIDDEKIKIARGILAERCGLTMISGHHGSLYMLDARVFCDADLWMPDKNESHAAMVDAAMFVVSEVFMMQRDDGPGKKYRFSGVIGYDKPYVRTGWNDSFASAVFEAAVQALEFESKKKFSIQESENA